MDRLRFTSLDLSHFKAFEHFTVSFGQTAVLVGPNNAGKSTVVTALRAIAQMMATAKRLRATYRVFQGDHLYWGHRFTTEQIGLDADNLRWESASDSVSLRATFSDNARVQATWPDADSEKEPYFVALDANRKSVREPSIAREVQCLLEPILNCAKPELSLVAHLDDALRGNCFLKEAEEHFLRGRRSGVHSKCHTERLAVS